MPSSTFAPVLRSSVLVFTLAAACGDDESAADASSAGSGSTSTTSTTAASSGPTTAASTVAATTVATTSVSSTGTGMGGSCLDDHAAGERFSVGDDCNFCDCNADGSTTCTTRICPGSAEGCSYGGMDYDYGERFPSTDACNECVCAASGLACTRRDCTVVEEGAILVESLDTPCGSNPAFTANAVLTELPFDEIVAPFAYQTGGPLYPETLPDTTVRMRIVYEDGFAVCRIPAPGQEAFDIEVMVEWITDDGAFDEGFHTYLRKNAAGFAVSWTIAVGAPAGGLDGTYDPQCLDPSGFAFDATIRPDQTADGHVIKLCETDILLEVGSFAVP